MAVKNECIKALEPDTDWIQLVKRVIAPIRTEIINAHDMSKPPMSDLQSWNINCPKLKFLVSFLCLGSPEFDLLPLSLENICQLIIYNSNKKFRPVLAKNEDTVDRVRHSRDTECPIIHYMTIKLYSTIRSKTLLQVFYQFGIILSYKRVMTFYQELSEIVKALYSKSDDKVLPSNLKQGLFTIFVDDNLDKNSSSVDGRSHFHGTALTVLQYPSQENSGICRTRCKFEDLSENELRSKSCPALDNFLNVQPLISKNTPQCAFETPSDSYSKTVQEEFKKQLSEEDQWLKHSVQCIGYGNESLSSWTAFHSHKNRDMSMNFKTINSVLPLIDYKSNTIELQYDIMATAVDYTKYLNPGQIAVGCSDQPLYAL